MSYLNFPIEAMIVVPEFIDITSCNKIISTKYHRSEKASS